MQKKQDLKVWLHPLTTKIMARALKIDHTETCNIRVCIRIRFPQCRSKAHDEPLDAEDDAYQAIRQ